MNSSTTFQFRLAEYIPGPPRVSLRGRTHGEERRLTIDAHGLESLEDELEIVQAVEDEVMLEEAYMADAGVSVEMHTGKCQDLPSPPTTQAELLRSPFQKAFELSQRVEIILNWLVEEIGPNTKRSRVFLG